MGHKKGKLSILTYPNMWEDKEHINLYERAGQEVINTWGAAKRAFLSSCIKDREWVDDESEDCELKFHGDTKNAPTNRSS